MDCHDKFRGWDFWLQARRPGTHIVGAWPDQALKVVAKNQLPANEWTHVAVSYDAASRQITLSGAASGTDTYLNVENFQFADTTRTATQLISSDTTAPTLITTSPADNAIGVAAGIGLLLGLLIARR